MKKKRYTLDNLYEFYSKMKKSEHFSAKESGGPIVVEVDGTMKFDDSSDTEGLMPVYLQACHTGENLNGSYISEDAMNNALASFKNRPILGYIHEVDGEEQFYTHNLHEDSDGNIIYDEVPVGIIPESCEAELVYDEDKDKTYVNVKGYIFEEYSSAAEILQREEECPVSVELAIRELSYNVKEKYLDIEDFYFSGVTILGKDDEGNDIKPGMSGSNISISDFCLSAEDIQKYSSAIKEMQEKLDTLLSRFNIESHEEGGKAPLKKIDELLAKYDKTIDDIDFDYESISDDELEAKFEEIFGENEQDASLEVDNNAEETEITEEMSNDSDDGDDDVVEDDTDESLNEDEGSEDYSNSEEASDSEDISEEEKPVEAMSRHFDISHEDIRYALYNLLSAYESQDNDRYLIIAVYGSYFVFESMASNHIYGQKYVVDDNEVSFDGDKYNLHAEYLTDDEYEELTNMRENYAALVQYKQDKENAELHMQREAILSDEKYSMIKDIDQYKNLVEHMDDYSLEDLEKEVKVVFADYMTNGGKFSVKNSNQGVQKKQLFNPENNKKKSRYGGIFKNN